MKRRSFILIYIENRHYEARWRLKQRLCEPTWWLLWQIQDFSMTLDSEGGYCSGTHTRVSSDITNWQIRHNSLGRQEDSSLRAAAPRLYWPNGPRRLNLSELIDGALRGVPFH